MVTDLENPFFARLAGRVAWEARANDSQVMLMTTHEDPYLERDLLERLRDRSVTGIIATPTGANIDAWRRLLDLGVSVTFVDRSIPDLPIDAVRIDNVDSAFTATDHLVRLGHTRIGIVSGPTTTTTGSERIEGYRRALAGADIPCAMNSCTPYRSAAKAAATPSAPC